jgi:hypothetical protein
VPTPVIAEAVNDWVDAGCPADGPGRDRLWEALHEACHLAAKQNPDIPSHRREDIAAEACEKLRRHFTRKAAAGQEVWVKGSGAALVRLAVRQEWLDALRAGANEVIGVDVGEDGEPLVTATAGGGAQDAGTVAADVEQVLGRMSPDSAELLRVVDGGLKTIEDLVSEELARDPRGAEAGARTRTRARLDKRVQRARLAFRELWRVHAEESKP